MNEETCIFLFGLFLGFLFTLIVIGLPSLVRIDNLTKQVKAQQTLIYQTYNVPIVEVNDK